MVSKKAHQLFFMRVIICLAMLFSHVAHAMDQAIIPEVESVVLKLFFTHNRDALPYDDEHSFAQTSRSNCALIYSVQQSRRACLHNYTVKNNIAFSSEAKFAYHPSWRMFGAIDISQEENNKKSPKILRMISLEIMDDGLIEAKSGNWENFIAQLPHKPAPFFNKNKKLCFYGFQKDLYIDAHNPHHSGMWKGVVEYTMKKQFPCELRMLGISDPTLILHIPLVEFLKFPVLLENILNSDGVIIPYSGYHTFRKCKSYFLDQVLLSHNYKDFKDFACVRDQVTIFDDLVPVIRNAFEQRYQEQLKTES
jgi:hypothetical protein